MPDFRLVAPFEPTGDQPKAIDRLVEGMGQDEGLSLHVITAKVEDAAEPWKGFAYCKPRHPKSVNAVVETAALSGRITSGRSAGRWPPPSANC